MRRLSGHEAYFGLVQSNFRWISCVIPRVDDHYDQGAQLPPILVEHVITNHPRAEVFAAARRQCSCRQHRRWRQEFRCRGVRGGGPGARDHPVRGAESGRHAIDGRTTRHAGYAISQQKRKLIEQVFGWMKTVGGLRKLRHRGGELVDWPSAIAFASPGRYA